MDKVPTPIREEKYILNRQDFNQLFTALHKREYRIVGPALRDGAIVYDELKSTGGQVAG
jgi:hypothetical protein